MLSNISIALLGMVDTAVIGRLDEPYYLGGVSLAMVVFNFLYWGLSFLRMGTTGIVAQHYGAQKNNLLRSSFAQACVLAVFISLFVLLLRSYISTYSFSIINGSDEAKHHAQLYFDIAIWAVPAVLLNLVVTGWFLGMYRARITLFLAVFINVINILLDLYFVVVLQLGVEGVAMATVIAQYSGLIIALITSSRVFPQYPGEWQKNELFNMDSIVEMLSVNQNLFLRTVCLLFVFAFFTHQSAAQGDNVLAANAILKNFYILIALSLDGFATASEVMTGRAIGSRDHRGFWVAVKTATVWSFIFSIIFTLVFLVLGDWMIQVMTTLDTVIAVAKQHLFWLVSIPVISVWCFVWDGVFIGARKAIEMRNSMLISTLLVFLPAWYVLQLFGNHGLWLAFLLFLFARSVSMSWYAWRIEKNNAFVPV